MASNNDRITPQLLQWLHSVIAPEYIDPRRTFNDIVETLRIIPSLSPRTDVYTHENGRSELLFCLYGTLPVNFRGNIYNIPILLWIPHQYPRQPPIAYVNPAKDMLIRPGNHVDANGRCYHPYLTGWEKYFDRSNIVDLCDVLKGVFGREPPVIARSSIPQQPQPQQPTPPPVPPLPAELAAKNEPPSHAPPLPTPGGPQAGGPQQPPPIPPLPEELAPAKPQIIDKGKAPAVAVPPPRPPKPGQEQQYTSVTTGLLPGGPRGRTVSPPPIPPQPHWQQQQYSQPALGGGNISIAHHGPPHLQYTPSPAASQNAPGYRPVQTPPAQQRYTAPPPLPPQTPPRPISYGGPPPPQAPPKPTLSASSIPITQQYHPSPLNPSQGPPPPPLPLPLQHAQHPIPAGPYQHSRSPPPPGPQFLAPTTLQPHPAPQLAPIKPQIIDLMNTDDDTTSLLLSIPTNPATDATPPPPLPPNPQKGHLLSSISSHLHTLALTHYTKTTTALEQAQVQRNAMLKAEEKMQAEKAELLHIDAIAERNIAILKERVGMAEGLVREVNGGVDAGGGGGGGGGGEGRFALPEIDKVVCAPTVVHTQLYDLVTEDMAIEDAIYVLGKALDRERIGLDVFLKHTRTLAREQFLLRATVKKIVKQIGLQPT